MEPVAMGLEIAKQVFQVHGLMEMGKRYSASGCGAVGSCRPALAYRRVRSVWEARELAMLGHEVFA